MPTESDNGKSASILNRVHLLVTIGIAILGGFISWQQFKITSWVDRQEQELERRKTITEQSAALLVHAKEYLDAISMSDDKKRRVLISLLQIERELRDSQTGELSDTAVEALPYQIALLAGDCEALAHIGAEPDELDLWLGIAKTSADVDVRNAAIGALKNVALVAIDFKTQEKCVNSIIELARRWNVTELRDQSIEVIKEIAMAYRHTDDADTTEVRELLGGALRELEATVAATSVSLDDPSAGETAEASDVARQQKSVEQQVQELATVRDLRQYYEQSTVTVSTDDEAALNSLLQDLRSEDSKQRRITRSRLSDYGERAVPELLELLRTSGDEYRVRIGVVTALMLMEQPVELKVEQAKQLVELLGDPDPTIRKNTAVFLGKLTDPGTIEIVRSQLEKLSTVPANLDNGNLIYNSVIVLGDWLQYNPSLENAARTSIRNSLNAIADTLESDTRQWSSTRRKISEYLN